MLPSLRLPLNKSFLAAAALGLATATATAATIYKANNTDALNLGSSWVGGVAPGAADVAQFDTSVIGTGNNVYTLGGDVSWLQLRVDRATATAGGSETITGNTLTLTNSRAAANVGTTNNFSAESAILLNSGTGASLVINSNVAVRPTTGGVQLWTTSRSLTLNGAVDLASNGVDLFSAGSSVTTLNGVVSGTGRFTKLSSGTLVLGGGNTFSGGISLAAGTLRVANSDAALGTGTLTVTGGATLGTASGGGARALSNAIVVNGTNTLTLDAGNAELRLNGTYSGADSTLAASSAGTVVLGGAATVGTVVMAGTSTANVLNIADGASVTAKYFNLGGGGSASGRVVQTGGTVTLVAGGFGIRIGHWGNGGNPGSSYAITGGTLDATGLSANTGAAQMINIGWDGQGSMSVGGGAGPATLKAYGVQLDANGNGGSDSTLSLLAQGEAQIGAGGLGSASATDIVVFNGGTLTGTANATWNAPVSLAGSGTLAAIAGVTVTQSGLISGAGSLTKSGSGAVTLTNNGNTFTGDVFVSAGTLNCFSGANGNAATSMLGAKTTGATDNARRVVVSSGATLALSSPTGASNVFGGGGMQAIWLPTLVLDGGTVTTGRFNTIGRVTMANGAHLTNSSTETSGSYGGYQFIGDITVAGTFDASGVGAFIDNKDSARPNHLLGGGVTNFIVGDITSATADLTVSTVLTNGSGDYSGAAGLAKSGAGTLALTANNTYTGATTVNAGTLQIGNGGSTGLIALASTLTVADGAALAFNYGAGQTLNFANAINGGALSELRQVGSGTTILSGNNAGFTGKTVVTSGVLRLQVASARVGDGALDIQGGTFEANNFAVATSALTGAGTLAFGSGALTVTGDSVFAGTISGTGAVSVADGVSLTLSGANTYTGATTVGAGGMLTLGAGGSTGAIGSSSVTVNPFASIVFNRSDLATNASAITGGGAVRAIGSGAVTLSGNLDNVDVLNHGAGSLTVLSATNLLAVGNVAEPALAPLVPSLSTVTTITATGTVGQIRNDAGTLKVTAAAVTGTTAVHGGAATVAADLRGAITVADGASLTVGAGAGDTVSQVSSTVSVAGAGKLVMATGKNTTLTGVSGTGVVEIDNAEGTTVGLGLDAGFTGTVALSGGAASIVDQSNLGGVTQLDFNGGTLTFTGTTAGAADSRTLDIRVNAVAGTLSYIHFGEELTDVLTLTVAPIGTGVIRNTGLGIINNAAFLPGQILDAGDPLDLSGLPLTATDFNDTLAIYNTGANADLIFNQNKDGVASGVFGGDAANPTANDFNLVKNGAAKLTLAADNTYTGTTTVNTGILQVGNAGTAGTLGTGAVTIHEGGTLAFNRADAITVANAIGGDGTLSQEGAGTVTFTTSGITVGALAGTGAIELAGTTLTVSSGNYSGVLTGTGSLVKQGAGTLVLSGNSALSSLVEIKSGVLQVGNGGTSGTIGTGDVYNLGGTLLINRSDAFVFASRVTGLGGLTQAGTGTTILTADNTYLGVTQIDAGTLRIGNGGTTGAISASGVIVNNGALVFDRSDDLTVGNAISGTGSFEHAGAGTLTLSGALTYSGTTSVSNGTLVLDAAALPLGDFASSGAGTLVIDGAGTVSKNLSGDGAVKLTGDGSTTTLASGAYAHTGTLTVTDGHTLSLGAVSGDAAHLTGSQAVVDMHAMLMGSGSLRSLRNSGTVSPGHSPGLIRLSGDFVQTGTGTLVMEIAGTGAAGALNGHDKIEFGGQATLDGALVVNLLGGFVPEAGYSAVLLQDTDTADGLPSFVGAFDSITVSGGRLVTSASTLAFMSGSSIAQTPGLALHDGVAAFADALSYDPDSPHSALADFIAISDLGARAIALQNASPVGLAALTAMPTGQAVREADELRRRAETLARGNTSLYGDATEWLAYAGGNGGLFNGDDAESDSPTFDSRSFGGHAGLERRLGDGSLSVGVRLGFDRGQADLHHGGGEIDQDHARVTVYATSLLGDAAYVTAGLGMGYSTFDTERDTIHGVQKASPDGWDMSASLDAGYVVRLGREWTFTPRAGLSVVSAQVGAFTETGSDLALSVDGYSHTSSHARLGATLMREWNADGFKRDAVRFGLDVAYERTLSGETSDITAAFANDPASEFTTKAPALAKDKLVIGPQAEWVLDEHSGINAGYRYELGFNGTTGHRFDVSYERRF